MLPSECIAVTSVRFKYYITTLITFLVSVSTLPQVIMSILILLYDLSCSHSKLVMPLFEQGNMNGYLFPNLISFD